MVVVVVWWCGVEVVLFCMHNMFWRSRLTCPHRSLHISYTCCVASPSAFLVPPGFVSFGSQKKRKTDSVSCSPTLCVVQGKERELAMCLTLSCIHLRFCILLAYVAARAEPVGAGKSSPSDVAEGSALPPQCPYHHRCIVYNRLVFIQF